MAGLQGLPTEVYRDAGSEELVLMGSSEVEGLDEELASLIPMSLANGEDGVGVEDVATGGDVSGLAELVRQSKLCERIRHAVLAHEREGLDGELANGF